MRRKPDIWYEKVFKKEKFVVNRDAITFSFFLILSFILWYLNSLGKDIEAEVSYPVKYINIPRERVIVDDLPSKLDLYLRGPGYSILKLKLTSGRTPVVIDIASVSYRRVPGSKTLSYYIKTSVLAQKLANQLRTECSVVSIKPDTLFFSFDRIISKKAPVTPSLEINTARQYFLSSPLKTEPDSVMITGPARILDTVKSVKTRYRKLTGLYDAVEKEIPLEKCKLYTLSERRVKVIVPVEQFTEAEIAVPISIRNVPDSIELKIFPDAVTVKCLVAVSDYKKISETPFEVTIDLKKVDLQKADKIAVEVSNIPSFVNSLRFSPEKVDFLVEKKAR
ncbi:MAG: YbbR-like domain-containing protein [Bacteroidales bacterium]|nr:YbbR-like domain-containing protein [Bacteroidales bacterium]